MGFSLMWIILTLGHLQMVLSVVLVAEMVCVKLKYDNYIQRQKVYYSIYLQCPFPHQSYKKFKK